jgi:anti-sigma factor RsiW
MSCERVRDSLDAYLDRELDVLTAVDFEEHLKGCGDCRALFERYQDLQARIKVQLSYFHAPASLEDKIRRKLGPLPRDESKWSKTGWRAWAIAASLLILLASGAVFFRGPTRPTGAQLIADEVVSSHIRSLMANHLVDVPSSDQHTVKPWFNGKLDFAPAVKDLSSEGVSLLGGRLDYVDARPVAAIVYKCRQHPINLFLWPSSGIDSKPTVMTIRGYHVVHNTQAHLAHWAVSDLNADELKQLLQDLER